MKFLARFRSAFLQVESEDLANQMSAPEATPHNSNERIVEELEAKLAEDVARLMEARG